MVSLVLCEPTPTSRRETADRIAGETEGVIIHPYDNYDVMAGQGTIGLELLEQVPDLDIVLVPISGGGMTAGIATAVKTINPRCKVSKTGERRGEEIVRLSGRGCGATGKMSGGESGEEGETLVQPAPVPQHDR